MHDTRVEGRGFEHDRTKQYVAVCSCGWQSEPQNTKRKADIEWDNHVLAVAKSER